MTEYNTLIVERREAVTLVTLNRPQALNALNAELLSELLDVMRRSAMLAMFFEHNGGETSKWSLKGHGKKPFFKEYWLI